MSVNVHPKIMNIKSKPNLVEFFIDCFILKLQNNSSDYINVISIFICY